MICILQDMEEDDDEDDEEDDEDESDESEEEELKTPEIKVKLLPWVACWSLGNLHRIS